MNPQPILIQSLAKPEAYPHATGSIEMVETHISWVILAGDFAYKLKKPVNLGFLDFSTLEKRRFYCEEELRLNRRLAPEIYLDVIAITGTPEHPVLGGSEPAIEYALKMRRFSQENLLSTLLAENRLAPRHIDALANEVSSFHRAIPGAAADSPFGTPDAVLAPALENFTQIHPLLGNPADLSRLDTLADWTEHEFAAHREDFAARKKNAFVRECHGDMHSGNMVLQGEAVLIFDCLEFNPNLRWVDVLSEAAFVMMDFMAHQRSDFAWRFINAYLTLTGDYNGLPVLRFYLVYRAMVRAKVAAIRASQSSLHNDWQVYASYITLAESIAAPPTRPLLAIAHGLSGSGKTTFTQQLLERLGAVRLRSDVERKRLFGLTPLEKSGSGIDSGLYTKEAGERTYARLAQLARTVIGAGFTVIVDATFLKQHERNTFHTLAQERDNPFAILDFRAAPVTLRERIADRERKEDEASEATLEVLELQLATQELLVEVETAYVFAINTEDQQTDVDVLTRQLRAASIGG